MSLFGTDGVRGKVGVYPITPDFALKLGWAAGRVLASRAHSKGGAKKVILGKDTRNSGYMFESAIQSGLSAAGIDAVLTGPLPTPAIAYLTKTLRASAGIVVSASHNPYYDNGIKFFSSEGEKLSDDIQAAIEAELASDIDCVDSACLGKSHRLDDATGRYIEFCKSTFPTHLSLAGLRIVVDGANGASYKAAPAVFSELGAEVKAIATSPDGLNINKGCGATDLTWLSKEVVAQKADLGIAVDGDGDRVMLVDHTGEIRNGDHVLYAIAKHLQFKGELIGGVVGTLMSNLGLEAALRDMGVNFSRAKVGDRYVMEQMKSRNWYLGGETSGHVICRNKTHTGDGIIAALQVLAALAEQELSLHDVCEEWEPYPQSLINVGFAAGGASPLEHQTVTSIIAEAEMALGTHTDSPKGRILLRKSGTEPLIRVMVEAQEMAMSDQWATQIADTVKAVS